MVLKKNLKNGFKLGGRAHEERSTVACVKEHREDCHDSKEESEDEDAIEISGDNYEAPDGGWGWMVTVGLILVFVSQNNVSLERPSVQIPYTILHVSSA